MRLFLLALLCGAWTIGVSVAVTTVESKPTLGKLSVAGQMPSLAGASWVNSPPLTNESLRGKVVLIDFWTYSCINCIRAMPYVNAWYQKYKDYGFVIIGVHAPEFAFEKDVANVKRALGKYGIHHPVVLDNDSKLWDAFHNRYWPAHYFIDPRGRIRAHHFGEGEYEKSELIIRQLLIEAGVKNLPAINSAAVKGEGAQAAAHTYSLSEETYVGYGRAERFSSPGGFVKDHPKDYAAPPTLKLNQWSLDGAWRANKENAVLETAPGKIIFRFYARDLHLVLGPGAEDKPARFRVLLDGAPPGGDHGLDVDASGEGVVKDHRLYQLIRQSKGMRERTFTIEFLDGGARAYAFTFG